MAATAVPAWLAIRRVVMLDQIKKAVGNDGELLSEAGIKTKPIRSLGVRLNYPV
jgi:hypothetical protein